MSDGGIPTYTPIPDFIAGFIAGGIVVGLIVTAVFLLKQGVW